MLKQAENLKVKKKKKKKLKKKNTRNIMRDWRVHLNACFGERFSKQLYYLVEMSSGFLIFNLEVVRNHPYGLNGIETAFYFILCVNSSQRRG